jgi:hypothetical protein
VNQQNTKAANPRLNKRRGEKFPGFFFIFLIDIIVARRQSHGRIVPQAHKSSNGLKSIRTENLWGINVRVVCARKHGETVDQKPNLQALRKNWPI